MSAEEKAPYKIEAEHQQAQLDALEREPLQVPAHATAPAAAGATGPDDAPEALSGVWKNAAKKRSCRRLELNTASFRDHPFWQLPTQLGDSP